MKGVQLVVTTKLVVSKSYTYLNFIFPAVKMIYVV